MRVELINPLPSALSHYEKQMVWTLHSAGHEVLPTSFHIDIEVGRRSRLVKVLVAFAALWRASRYRSDSDRVLVLWPMFGYLDGLLFRRAAPRGQVCVIMHDPVPLRPAFGYSYWAKSVAQWACRHQQSAEWIVHTDVAENAVKDQGIEASRVLPHPILAGSETKNAYTNTGVVTVLGQFKPTRDLQMLECLAECDVDDRFSRRILGRGWPSLPGWHVTDRFISESEFEAAIQESAVVVIPYSNFFQSNVAVRCLESLTPVLGPDHEFLRRLFGEHFSGLLLPGSDPCSALDVLTKLRHVDMLQSRERYQSKVSQAWRTV